jgi:GNAT superfamily N-acetyltransferase
MDLRWISEQPSYWDADKERLIAGAPAGIFDRRFKECKSGELMPGTWWRVEVDGGTAGYGWMDTVWGDAEILLVTAPALRGKGIGTFILDHLEQEAKSRGLNYVYNIARASHPEREKLTAWLMARGFTSSEDGSLLRSVPGTRAKRS